MLTEPSRRQAIENAAFLRVLAATGNGAMAAEAIGMRRTTFIKRRRKWPGFAADWDAALVTAAAALTKGGGKRAPDPLTPGPVEQGAMPRHGCGLPGAART